MTTKNYVPRMLILALILLLAAPAWAQESKDIVLPERPALANFDLYTALERRQTTRKYKTTELSATDLAAILWASNGVNRADGKRTAPSAHGKQYMDVYLLGPTGNYLYDPLNRKLKFLSASDLKHKVAVQEYVALASHILVLVVDLDKVSEKAGSNERKLNFGNSTAGAIAQNVYLMSAAKKVGTCLVANIKEDEIRKGLGLTKSQIPVYIMPLGYLEK
ncbi:MAG: nitroreductase family protein [Deltaproteobacteria bacterium]|nr:nitroreductase family protein [Deltaproteobacteria bacterium]MBF0524836.1 nitroreductase family protein [Deltaproteobacteria bacterium]